MPAQSLDVLDLEILGISIMVRVISRPKSTIAASCRPRFSGKRLAWWTSIPGQIFELAAHPWIQSLSYGATFR